MTGRFDSSISFEGLFSADHDRLGGDIPPELGFYIGESPA